MSETSRPEDVQAVDYTGVLRRRWWIIAAATIIGTVGALGYLLVAHKIYTATASVAVSATAANSNQVSNGRTTGSVNLDTEAQVVDSLTVAKAAAKRMHATDTPQQLMARVSVTVPPNSQVLTISCTSASPAIAASCAQSFAQAYLNYVSSQTTSLVNGQILVLQKKIDTLQSGAASLSIEVASLPSNSSHRANASVELTSDQNQLTSLNGQLAQLTQELANPSGGSIITSATPPTSPSSPKALIVLPSGLVAGLLIGLIIAVVVDRRDRRIRGPRDLARVNVPVLMSLPLKDFTPELAIAAPRSGIGREFSELAHVLSGSAEADNQIVLVTGSADGRGVDLVAANLATALSRYEPEVTLVCADLEGSVIPAMVGLPSAPGLTDLLAASTPNGSPGRRPTAAPRLRVIAPGSAAGKESADLQPDAVVQLLVSLRDKGSWVVVAAPSVASDPDVYTLAQAADAVVLVAEAPQARSDQVGDVVQQLERTGATVLGAVLLPSPKVPTTFRPPQPPEGSNVRQPGRAVPTVPDDDTLSLPAVAETPASVRGT
jgi:capsular polysaccharide biosynthesis protein/Mrp family chromosome partitioning ATPase